MPQAAKQDGTFTDEEAVSVCDPSEPIPGFPLKYRWHTGPWRQIFDEQIKLIQDDITHAKAEDKLLVYLSCPISSRGGGYSGTNVDIARRIERRLLERWGEAFWILNPAQYQLESKAGTGLMNRHAKQLNIDLARLRSLGDPNGGDYMRMWTTVLVSNAQKTGTRDVGAPYINTGQFFDAFYFIGPRDVQNFFGTDGVTLTAGIQDYFARKFAADPDFHDYFSVAGIAWQRAQANAAISSAQQHLRDSWEGMRHDFLRYYAVRASVNFSLGSHDEWLIFKLLNQKRREVSRMPLTSWWTAMSASRSPAFSTAARSTLHRLNPASRTAIRWRDAGSKDKPTPPAGSAGPSPAAPAGGRALRAAPDDPAGRPARRGRLAARRCGRNCAPSRADARWRSRCVRASAGPSASRIASSDSLSSAEVASSSSRSGASLRKARAMAMRWRWPPESFTPRSPTMVRMPSGSSSMKSQRAAIAASSTSSSVASGRP